MSIEVGKRKRDKQRSESAEPDFITPKRFLISKDSKETYYYKTPCGQFFINEGNISTMLKKDVQYEFNGDLKKSLLLTVTDKNFLSVLNDQIQPYQKEIIYQETKPRRIDTLFHGYKKNLKLASIKDCFSKRLYKL